MPDHDPIADAVRLLRDEADVWDAGGDESVAHAVKDLRDAAKALEAEGKRLRARIAALEAALRPLADAGGYIKRYHSSPVYRGAGLWVPSSTAEPEPPRLMYGDAIMAHAVLGGNDDEA